MRRTTEAATIKTVTSLAFGAATMAGALWLTWWMMFQKKKKSSSSLLVEAKERRARLPHYIFLVRHGESECNADRTLWRTKPDNLVRLTDKGLEQARQVGRRIERIFQTACNDAVKRVHLIVSPFERTLQTAQQMRHAFEHRIVRTDVQPRIREQEFGNIQGDDFITFRQEQERVGRFWYRFPTGESGADVYDRVQSWWFDSVLSVNERVGYDPVDALVVVTHGLTMRFVLMQLYSWSPTTFHTVWNAENCELYVLTKDLSKPGISPYVLDDHLGDMPRSSINLQVELRSGTATTTRTMKLDGYLEVPPPRTTRYEIIKKKLAQQHGLDENDIASISYVSFMDVGCTILGPQTTSGNAIDEGYPTDTELTHNAHQRAKQEMSCRFPNVKWLPARWV